MEHRVVLESTREFVKRTLENEGTGHDFFHIQRVHAMALKIAKEENDVDMFVVELAALLHDIADHKFHNGDDTKGSKVAREWLESQQVDEKTITHVCDIILHLSYKGAQVENKIATKEGMIVQDADRLDALGAIGIARAFAYGGAKNRPLYDPAIRPVMHQTFEQYKKNATHTINHFYEKLLLLKDKMNTNAGRRIAEQRHDFLLNYLAHFYSEWNGEEVPQKPRVGIGIIVIKNDKVLLGKRKGSHASGTWSFPGGHLEFGESWEACAQREVEEETSICIKNVRFSAVTNDMFEKENKHYITLFMLAEYDSGQEKVMESEKCHEWQWFEWNSLPRPLMKPLENLLKQGYSPFK